jgi:TPR repeat protein
MKAQKRSDPLRTLIDAEVPWKVLLSNATSGGYTGCVADWKKVLARAKRGDAEAEWDVGERYADGCKDKRGRIVVKRSPKKAVEWLRRAAEHGNSSAQNNLANLLSNDNGTRKNLDEAFEWYKKALRAGDSHVGQNIAITYRQIGKHATAVKWFRRCARQGHGEALIQLGIHYYWGKGIRKDPKAAVRCFRSAIRSKNISEWDRDDAFFLLGLAHYEGKGVRRSLPRAIELFKRANKDDDNQPAREFLRLLNA